MPTKIQRIQANAHEISLEIIEWDHADEGNEFARRIPTGTGTLFHRAEWDRVFAIYNLPTIRLAAVRNGEIVGLLPLVQQKSRLFGNRLVSLPWFDAAGVLTNNPNVEQALIDAALMRALDCGANSVELRQISPLDRPETARLDKVLMRLNLENDPEVMWQRFSSKVRNQIRKAQKLGLVFETGGRELLPEFYSVYSRRMRDLGSPPHSRALFDAVFEMFPDETASHIVRFQGRVVGVALTMNNGDRLEIPWAASLKTYDSFCVNHLMYWHMIEGACRQGFRWFHFGRSSRGSGTYHFKKQWGAEPVQLHWYSRSTKGADVVVTPPRQESFGLVTRIWRHLPMWMVRQLGPKIIAKVP